MVLTDGFAPILHLPLNFHTYMLKMFQTYHKEDISIAITIIHTNCIQLLLVSPITTILTIFLLIV